ncbi:MAG: hypothetical protein GC160_08370 [Acidobacteria bacterium]|nr:hypothetical protein [Acidobacteriota bacterium]
MARPSVSYQKRRKEIARLEKRREKEARREERKMEKDAGTGGPPIEVVDPADLGLPDLEHLRSEENRLPENIRKRFDPALQAE